MLKHPAEGTAAEDFILALFFAQQQKTFWNNIYTCVKKESFNWFGIGRMF